MDDLSRTVIYASDFELKVPRKLDTIITLLRGQEEEQTLLKDAFPQPLSHPDQLERMAERLSTDRAYGKKLSSKYFIKY